jgi:lipopolysaccharide transport system ATP-binding protein
MSDVVIQVDRLSKRYRLGVLGTGTLRHDLNGWWHRLRGKEDPSVKVGEVSPAPGQSEDEMWALRGVSFEVRKGEILGVIGRNGAGKSTLLKILSRITAPTVGEVRVKGRIASLLEVGTGFHPELTGRENIFLNGAILGMTKAEIKGKLDEIVAFAGVERYLDTPVKRYSSGMYVRLAFAVAAHLEPEILIVDEVLAVGDAEFQKKCLGKMKDVAGKGRTILFVSHNMDAVRSLCQRCIRLKGGEVHGDGPSDEIIEGYFNDSSNKYDLILSNAAYGLAVQKVKLKNSRGMETSLFQPGEDLIVEIAYDVKTRLVQPYITVGVIGVLGPCFTANMLLDGARPEAMEGAGTITCRFRSIPLLPQNYIIKMGVRAKNGLDAIMEYREVASFKVTGNLAEYGFKGAFLERASRYTPVVVPYEWGFPDGTKTPVSLDKSSS